jgi:hypothetical protein
MSSCVIEIREELARKRESVSTDPVAREILQTHANSRKRLHGRSGHSLGSETANDRMNRAIAPTTNNESAILKLGQTNRSLA